jgi:nicotinate-nucleotide pyrophosphorylase (carboxylating)
MHILPWAHELVARALAEDLGAGDITSQALIPPDAQIAAAILARHATIAAALSIAAHTFRTIDPQLQITLHVAEGARMEPDTTLLTVSGSARAILAAERVALNIAQRASGIAAQTAAYVAAVAHTHARILDTRKTPPGLRLLDKYAVRVGGGHNHRIGLYDAVLIKDNHRAYLAAGGNSVADAVRMARASVGPFVRVEVEVESIEDAERAAAAGADVIMLDNMAPDAMRAAVQAIGCRALVEASGGVSLATVAQIAETGVDLISVGALTHSVRAADLSLEVVSTGI